MKKIQLGVIFGSRTCEHDVSIISAIQLMRAVNRDKYDIYPIYISQKGEWFTGNTLYEMNTFTPFDPYGKGLHRVSLDLTAGSGALISYERIKGIFGGLKQVFWARLDCIIPVFHGLHGEDGSMQGLLELADIPYTSTGIVGSAVGMDKIIMKKCFRGDGFPVLPDCSILRSEWTDNSEYLIGMIEQKLAYPVFVKPANLGSSIGVSRANNKGELVESIEIAFEYDRRLLIEKGLDHPIEVNCSVLGFDGEISTAVLEMPTSSGDLLNFSEKYLSSGGSKGMASLKRVLPAPIGDELTERIKGISKEVFRALDCKGVVRIDFMLDRFSDNLYITEINTIPGSMAYYLWVAAGMSYTELIDKMIGYALKAHRYKNENAYAYSSEILSGIRLGGKKSGKL
jgi:D-alanine-D-alanine ligase